MYVWMVVPAAIEINRCMKNLQTKDSNVIRSLNISHIIEEKNNLWNL